MRKNILRHLNAIESFHSKFQKIIYIYIYTTGMGQALRSMADNSFECAAARGLVRKNAVHGEDEARLVLEESFGAHNERGESHSVTGTGDCEEKS